MSLDAAKLGQEILERTHGYRDGTATPHLYDLELADAGWDIGRPT